MPLNVTKQIQSIHRTLVDELAHTVQFAALADRYAQIARDTELPPYREALVFGISPDLEADVRSDFRGQAARLAVLSMLVSMGAAVARLLTLRRTLEHVAKVGETGFADHARIAADVRTELRCGGEVALLDAVVTDSRPELDEARKWLDALVKLREPLARRAGMVELTDVPEGVDGLRVVWRKNVVALDGNQFEELSRVLPGHPGLGLRFIEQTRLFRAGQPLGLTSSDCDDIAISLSCLSLALCEEAHREMGTVLSEP